jgi:serine/threonine protein phosphatase PrpC
MKYSIHSQNPKYPLADLVDPVVSGFLIISQEEVVDLLNAKDKRIAELEKALQRQAKRVKLLEPLLGIDKISPLLKKLLVCCDGLSVEYAQANYGAANEWVRHIDSAYQNYQSSIDEYQEEALKEIK